MLTCAPLHFDAFVVAVDVAQTGGPANDGFQHIGAKAFQIVRIQLAERGGREIDQVIAPQLIADVRKTSVESRELPRGVVAADDNSTGRAIDLMFRQRCVYDDRVTVHIRQLRAKKL